MRQNRFVFSELLCDISVFWNVFVPCLSLPVQHVEDNTDDESS